MKAIKANARILVQQDVDLALKCLEQQILRQPSDEVLLTSSRQNKHYKANKVRMFLQNGQLFW